MKSYTIRTRTLGPHAVDHGLTVVLKPGDVIRLPDRISVRAVAGSVWLTAGGEDIRLRRGQEHCTSGGPPAVLMSNVSEYPATVALRLDRRDGCPDGSESV